MFFLLYRWRGPNPVAHAILSGEASTGVTIMQIVEPPHAGGPRFDHGPILLSSAPVSIPPRATVHSLTAILAQIGARLTLEVLDRLDDYLAAARSQTPSSESASCNTQSAPSIGSRAPSPAQTSTLTSTSPSSVRHPHVPPSTAPKLKRERAEIDFATQTAAEIDCSARALEGRFALCAYLAHTHTPIKLSWPLSPQLVRHLLPFCIPAATAFSSLSTSTSPASTEEIGASCIPSAAPARPAHTAPATNRATTTTTSTCALPAGAVLFSRYPSRSRHVHLPMSFAAASDVSCQREATNTSNTSPYAHVNADFDVGADAGAPDGAFDGALLVRCRDGGFVGFGRVQIVASRGQPTRRPLSAREFANGYLRDRRTPLVLSASPSTPLPSKHSVSGRERSDRDTHVLDVVTLQTRSVSN